MSIPSNVFNQAQNQPPQYQTRSEILGYPRGFTGTTVGGVHFVDGEPAAPPRKVATLRLPANATLNPRNLFQ